VILRALFGLTDVELFGAPERTSVPMVDGYSELVSRIEDAHGVSRSEVETFLDQTEVFRTLDRQRGAAQLVDSMNRHLETLSDALTFTVLPSARIPIASALAGTATLGAWQALDVGAADRAWRNYEMAKQAAREAGHPEYLAHAMGEQAYVLVDAGRTDLAVELVSEALAISASIPPRLKAWLLGAQAEILALSGDSGACRRALDSASQLLPGDDILRDPDMPSIFLTTAHLARWRGHSLALLGDGQAVTDLYAALDGMDSTFTRARAGLLCDLAQAHLMRGEYGDATQRLREARRIASRTGSTRYLRRVERISGQIPS
jgi:tetratricopeptide (TPR) repeat protein